MTRLETIHWTEPQELKARDIEGLLDLKLSEVSVGNTVFWDVTLCSLVEDY
jgi:hypothetical protein